MSLIHEEALIFEIGNIAKTGVDIETPANFTSRLNGLERGTPLALEGLSEPEAIRHYVRLSRQNHAIDTALYPLGSCTMKHNARLGEKLARASGFADIHPLQPQSTVQGALLLMTMLGDWLKDLTGMPSIALSPKAGAHGELCGMMCIDAALKARGERETRRIVLVPVAAHGTNPATAAHLGFEIETIAARPDGRLDYAALKARLDARSDDIAALMLTNPNTCGLFERDIIAIADAIHQAGGYFYCDGANFNAIIGRAKPGAMGVDAMHINLHKTFSTPHGGGGPGAGPTVLSERLAAFAPLPLLIEEDGRLSLIETQKAGRQSFGRQSFGRQAFGHQSFGRQSFGRQAFGHQSFGRQAFGRQSFGRQAFGRQAFGRMTAFHGQMGMFVRALSFILSHGRDGLRQVADDAVLNANYIAAQMADLMPATYPGPHMHEVLFDERALAGTGITALDFAKALIDEGYHPMTIYFPLIVPGAMLVEPTESESKESLDQFIATLRRLMKAALAGEAGRFIDAPHNAPRRRLDETRAARQPILRYRPPTVESQFAAE